MMPAEFYLFNVGVGQSAALKLSNDRWCVFDIGKSSDFSPVNWIVEQNKIFSLIGTLLTNSPMHEFKFLKATISHHHGNHVADYKSLLQYGPECLLTVLGDEEYLRDVIVGNPKESIKDVLFFMEHTKAYGSIAAQPDYGGALIEERCLSVAEARNIGGESNSKINNASIITRIDIYGNSILLCGDMEKEAWDAITSDTGDIARTWRPFLSNIDIMVAPHHGHKSGFSANLLNIAKPSVVLVSVKSINPDVDPRYSQEPVRGIKIGNDSYRCITTQKKGHIKVQIYPPGSALGKGVKYWSFGENALKYNEKK